MTRQHVARSGIHLGTQANSGPRPLAAQIEVTILEPGFLACLLVELERQWCALTQHGQRRRVDFDITRRDFGVRVALRAGLDDTVDRDAVLRAQPVRIGEHVCLTEHDLRDAGRIAQVDEDDAAVVATARYPAGQRHLLTGVGGPQ
jgi:hypothetical protein